MKIEKKEKYTIVSPTESSFEEFYKVFQAEKEAFESEHIFVNFLDSFSVNVSQLEKFSNYSETKNEDGNSFVLITTTVEIDDFEDESLSVVPTLGEAEDVLEMDDIERDLLGL